MEAAWWLSEVGMELTVECLLPQDKVVREVVWDSSRPSKMNRILLRQTCPGSVWRVRKQAARLFRWEAHAIRGSRFTVMLGKWTYAIRNKIARILDPPTLQFPACWARLLQKYAQESHDGEIRILISPASAVVDGQPCHDDEILDQWPLMRFFLFRLPVFFKANDITREYGQSQLILPATDCVYEFMATLRGRDNEELLMFSVRCTDVWASKRGRS
jgi:hypothetical protein